MNYCNPVWNNNGKLSPGDIVGVQTVYGKRAGSIVGVNSLCLAAAAVAPNTTLDHCAPANEQQWSLGFWPSFPVHFQNRNGLNLDDWAWNTALGAPVGGYPRNTSDTANQEWNFGNVALRTGGGKCLDIYYNNQVRGNFVQLWDCNGTGAQQWTFTPAGEIRSTNGLCLDATNGSTADGTPLQIWDCNGTPAQKFKWFASLLMGPANKCVEVAGGALATASGSRIQLMSCNSALNQRWSVVGQIRNAWTNTCINSASAPFGLGPTVLWNCYVAPAETWEFFP